MTQPGKLTGQDIQNAAKCVKKVGQEIDALISIIQEDFESALFQAGQIKEREGIKFVSEDYEYPNEWLLASYIFNMGLKPPKAKKSKAVIAIKISLLEETPIPGLDEPLVHVLFCGGSMDDASWDLDEFQLPPAETDKKTVLKGERLWEWLPPAHDPDLDLPWEDRQWAFSLPLIKLNALEDVRQQITKPIIQLINGQSPKEAFSKASAVIRFSYDQEKEGYVRLTK